MAIEYPRVMISDRVWEQLKAALEEAKHSRAGAPAEMSDRDFLEAVLYLNRVGCPWRDLPAELGYWHAVSMCAFAAGKSGEYGGGFGSGFSANASPKPVIC